MEQTRTAFRRLRLSLRVLAQLYLVALLIKLTPASDANSLNLLLRLNRSIK
jgi:hypothetical protein